MFACAIAYVCRCFCFSFFLKLIGYLVSLLFWCSLFQSTTIDVPHQYAFQRKSLAKVLEKFRTSAHQVTQANESSSDYIQQLSLLAKQWRVRWSGPAPICEFDFRSAGSTFHNRGEAEVVEKVSSKTGALMLTIDVPRRLQTLVEVSCKIEHQPDYTSALKPTLSGRLETSQGFSWEHLLTQTQESLFAQVSELQHGLLASDLL